MGLDIYAGTLTRYYSHNWKTVVQQMEKLLITRKKCPQLRSRLQWRTGGIRS